MSMTVVFAMMAAASAVETGANMKGLHPDFRDTFRNDATLGFMRNQLRREDPFAEAQQGPAYDSKKAQKAAAGVAKDNQQEAQPGPDNVLKKAQKAAAKEQEQAQQGPNHDSKEAQKAAAKVAKDNQQEAQEAPNLDAAEAQKAAAKEQEEAQQGPSYDSKEAQKAAAKVAKDNQPKAVSVKDPVQVVSDGVKTADKFLDKLAGTGASQKQAKKNQWHRTARMRLRFLVAQTSLRDGKIPEVTIARTTMRAIFATDVEVKMKVGLMNGARSNPLRTRAFLRRRPVAFVVADIASFK